MRILADLHHGQLYKSHELLFENRLGYELFRPIGIDWYKEGYWGWADNESLVQQFLGHPNLLIQPQGLNGRGIGRVTTSDINDYHHMLICYDAFMNMPFDVLLASLPAHIPVFKRLSEKHPSHPKVVFQIGNMWTDYPDVKNILNATNIPIDSSIHHFNYYPEFELEFCRRENILPVNKCISSFIHLNNFHSRKLFFELEMKMEGIFKEYGIANREGSIPDRNILITEKMLESQFIWHYKCGGEGYGFIIHEAFASGRPPLVNYEEIYKYQRAGELMRPGINCIDVSFKTSQQIFDDLIEVTPRWKEMSLAAKHSFNKRVNFETQGYKIKSFMENLI